MPKRFFNPPLYLQLRDTLAERIASGEWKPGRGVPSEVDLAREFGVSQGSGSMKAGNCCTQHSDQISLGDWLSHESCNHSFGQRRHGVTRNNNDLDALSVKLLDEAARELGLEVHINERQLWLLFCRQLPGLTCICCWPDDLHSPMLQRRFHGLGNVPTVFDNKHSHTIEDGSLRPRTVSR